MWYVCYGYDVDYKERVDCDKYDFIDILFWSRLTIL